MLFNRIKNNVLNPNLNKTFVLLFASVQLVSLYSCRKLNKKKEINYPHVLYSNDSLYSKYQNFFLNPINLLSLEDGQLITLEENFIDSSYVPAKNYIIYPFIADLNEKSSIWVNLRAEKKNAELYIFQVSSLAYKKWYISKYVGPSISFISDSPGKCIAFIRFSKFISEDRKAILEVYENGDELTKTINIAWW